MLRIFRRYHPRQIALHVKSLFRGKLSIDGVGDFEFAEGRMLLPQSKTMRSMTVVNEVNAEIKQLVKATVA